jgi:membrane protein YqaA with SNARE-associated domain
MTFLDSTTAGWLLAGGFAGGLLSALVPWVNAEILLLAALPAAMTHGAGPGLVVALTLGQMVGKSVVYWLSREAIGRTGGRVTARTERWRTRFVQHPRSAVAIVGASALLGVPPFYIVSIVAGTLRMSFAVFLTVGGLGRLAHFTLIASVPQAVSSW